MQVDCRFFNLTYEKNKIQMIKLQRCQILSFVTQGIVNYSYSESISINKYLEIDKKWCSTTFISKLMWSGIISIIELKLNVSFGNTARVMGERRERRGECCKLSDVKMVRAALFDCPSVFKTVKRNVLV